MKLTVPEICLLLATITALSLLAGWAWDQLAERRQYRLDRLLKPGQGLEMVHDLAAAAEVLAASRLVIEQLLESGADKNLIVMNYYGQSDPSQLSAAIESQLARAISTPIGKC